MKKGQLLFTTKLRCRWSERIIWSLQHKSILKCHGAIIGHSGNIIMWAVEYTALSLSELGLFLLLILTKRKRTMQWCNILNIDLEAWYFLFCFSWYSVIYVTLEANQEQNQRSPIKSETESQSQVIHHKRHGYTGGMQAEELLNRSGMQE